MPNVIRTSARRAARRAVVLSVVRIERQRREDRHARAFWRDVARIVAESMVPRAEIPSNLQAFAESLGIQPDFYTIPPPPIAGLEGLSEGLSTARALRHAHNCAHLTRLRRPWRHVENTQSRL